MNLKLHILKRSLNTCLFHKFVLSCKSINRTNFGFIIQLYPLIIRDGRKRSYLQPPSADDPRIIHGACPGLRLSGESRASSGRQVTGRDSANLSRGFWRPGTEGQFSAKARSAVFIWLVQFHRDEWPLWRITMWLGTLVLPFRRGLMYSHLKTGSKWKQSLHSAQSQPTSHADTAYGGSAEGLHGGLRSSSEIRNSSSGCHIDANHVPH